MATRTSSIFLATFMVLATVLASGASAEVPPQEEPRVEASPKQPWGEFTLKDNPEQKSEPLWAKILLWVPNRVLDFIDIFRVDVGVGPTYGAVARVTKYGQVGFRSVAPLSVRVGDFGRTSPVLLEHSSEMGIGPAYLESKDRKVCNSEIGIGADLLIGAYAGICFEEVLDFAAGLFFLDVKNDDLR